MHDALMEEGDDEEDEEDAEMEMEEETEKFQEVRSVRPFKDGQENGMNKLEECVFLFRSKLNEAIKEDSG